MSETLITAFTTALNGISADFQSMVEVALPVGLGIFAVGFAIRAGMRFFKSVAN